MKSISEKVRAVPRSGIRVILDIAQRPGVIHLEIGQPDFPTPAHIVEAAHKAALDGQTGYTPNQGYPSLREAISRKLKSENKIAADPEQIIVTVGAMEALYVTLMTVIEPGDTILVPSPGYPNYHMATMLCGGETIGYPLTAAEGYQPDVGAIEALIRPTTKAIVINSPANPTGAVISSARLQAIAEMADRHDLYVISDECYEKIVFEGAHVSPASFGGDDRYFTIGSFSKTYAMTGWRAGYVASPRDLAPMFVKLQEAIVACAPSVSQIAAEAALEGSQECVAEMVDSYRERRDLAVGILKSNGLYRYTPGGAFYLLVDVPGWEGDTYAFARNLLEKKDVAVAPGETFGELPYRVVRISLAARKDLLEEGLTRLCNHINDFRDRSGERRG